MYKSSYLLTYAVQTGIDITSYYNTTNVVRSSIGLFIQSCGRPMEQVNKQCASVHRILAKGAKG